MDVGIAWRALLTQLGAVLALSLLLAAILPGEFFEDWGWLSGPIAWIACSVLTARVVGLPIPETLTGALLAGGLAVPAVFLDLHWLGVLVAIAAFGVMAGITAGLLKRFRIDTVEPLGDEDRALLEHHKPVLVYDPQEDYRASSVEMVTLAHANVLRHFDGSVIARAEGEPALTLTGLGGYEASERDHLAFGPDRAGDARVLQRRPELAHRIYGRVVRGDRRTWLQYWLWLYHNPKNLLGFGEHEGDWEMVQVGLGPDGSPEVATYSQHRSGEARSWPGVRRAPDPDGSRPLVYLAGLSHAAYFHPGAHPYPTGVDHAPEGPRIDDAVVEPFGEWALWPGYWGNVPPGLIGRLGRGPRGPGHQGKWSWPARFHVEARARTGSRAVGWVLRTLGRLTAPRAPEIVARRAAAELLVDYKIDNSLLRRTRHLLLTAHTPDERHVLASRVARDLGTGEGTVSLGELGEPAVIKASAFNRLRQRSPIVAGPDEI